MKAQNPEGFQEVSFVTSDNIEISASLAIPKNQTQPVPAIILIHQGGSSRQEWFDLPLTGQLIQQGYAVLAYDIRIHGRSGKDNGDLTDLFNNPARAPLDLKATINHLQKDQRIDGNRIGIVGASIGANLACVAMASDDYEIQSVVSLSAKVSAVQNLSGLNEPVAFKNAFFIASMDEQSGKRKEWANELFVRTTGHRQLEIAEGNKHGSFILKEHFYLQKSIVQWFEKTLKD